MVQKPWSSAVRPDRRRTNRRKIPRMKLPQCNYKSSEKCNYTSVSHGLWCRRPLSVDQRKIPYPFITYEDISVYSSIDRGFRLVAELPTAGPEREIGTPSLAGKRLYTYGHVAHRSRLRRFRRRDVKHESLLGTGKESES